MHQVVTETASIDDLDVLVQRDAIVAALVRLGHQIEVLPISLNLESARQQLFERAPALVFNLVESLGGTDRLVGLAILMLEALQIPFTGADSFSTLVTANKLLAKERLRELGLPTPDWLTLQPGDNESKAKEIRTADWIIKPTLEHASFGIVDQSVVSAQHAGDLRQECARRTQASGRPHFAEAYIDGREFNLSLLNRQVLPPAEIDFVGFPAGKPKIVGRSAKWDVDSFEYNQTPRRFEFPDADEPLLEELAVLAVGCWDGFGLRGYARVDFRIDRQGRPLILEINTNPCLSPDAGFAAAVAEAGWTFDVAIQRIVAAALPH